jgi:hypothetical protein
MCIGNTFSVVILEKIIVSHNSIVIFLLKTMFYDIIVITDLQK